METIELREEYIKLGQALKAAGMVGFRCRSQGGHSGWSGEGKWRCRISERQKIICRSGCRV